jgi:serine protease Do
MKEEVHLKRKPPKRRKPASNHPANFYVPIIERVKHSVVSITTTHPKRNYRHADQFRYSMFFPEGERPPNEISNMGSGFVIHPKGYLLTSEHVIHNAAEIHVKFYNEQEFPAQLIWADEKRDLAVIQISSRKPLRPLSLGSSETSKVGEIVISIGNPLGLEHTITTGILSAKNRNILRGDKLYGDIIQTDCAINPGNSGGPLINLNGEVIGMNAFIAKNNQGLSFSIGIDGIKETIDGRYLKS